MMVMRKSKRKGFHALCRALDLDQRMIADDDIGFSIAPRVNAASRMGHPRDAFDLFTATTDETARERAMHLEKINSERKGVVASIVKEIKKRLVMRVGEQVIVIGNPEWRPSLLGLAANSLAEEYKRPAFVWGRDGRGIIKGSCRSGGTSSVVALMQRAAESFIEYGGHHASGGFSVHEEKIHSLNEQLNAAYDSFGHEPVVETSLPLDADLTLDQVTDALYRNISALSPFGVGNEKPRFRFLGITPERVTAFGKATDHTKLTFAKKFGSIEAIAFFKTPERFTEKLLAGKPIDLIAHVEKATFRGRTSLRLRIVDIL